MKPTTNNAPIGAKRKRGRPQLYWPDILRRFGLTRRSQQRFTRVLRLFNNDERVKAYFMSGRDHRTRLAMERVALLPAVERERCLQFILDGQHPRNAYDRLLLCLWEEGRIDENGMWRDVTATTATQPGDGAKGVIGAP
jgi:hypothetical protein